MDEKAFWQKPEQVEAFAARPTDSRLTELLKSYRLPNQIRVLDLGCAGGRNTVILAEQGFDMYAVDNSGDKKNGCAAGTFIRHRIYLTFLRGCSVPSIQCSTNPSFRIPGNTISPRKTVFRHVLG